ncbi:hypothetical protein JCM5353_005395 [Sporobolomyces roseus]
MSDQRRLSTDTTFSVATTLVPEPHSNLSPAQRIAGRQAKQDVKAAKNIDKFNVCLNTFVQSTNAKVSGSETTDVGIVDTWKATLLNRLKGAYNFNFYHETRFDHIESVVNSMTRANWGGSGRRRPFILELEGSVSSFSRYEAFYADECNKDVVDYKGASP